MVTHGQLKENLYLFSVVKNTLVLIPDLMVVNFMSMKVILILQNHPEMAVSIWNK
jgi:hypothetical protein